MTEREIFFQEKSGIPVDLNTKNVSQKHPVVKTIESSAAHTV